ncbi:MAG: DinB family protein [Acidobacteriaceae bacterium]|nr:DinB family protein [Acidobacteriaceae bacterium]
MPSRRSFALLAPLCALSLYAQTTPSTSGTLNQHDREYAMSQLHATRKLFLDAVAGLTPEQWNFKAAPDRWSIAECAEHIALSEDFISGMVLNQLLKSPANPEKRAEVKVTDEQIATLMTDRSAKFKAPEPIAPKRKWENPADAVAEFKRSRDEHIAYIETTQDDLRNHFLRHPAMGMLDAYQWILLMSGHTERHTLQILEVKADPKFPK